MLNNHVVLPYYKAYLMFLLIQEMSQHIILIFHFGFQLACRTLTLHIFERLGTNVDSHPTEFRCLFQNLIHLLSELVFLISVPLFL